jgi:phage terminase small subunit
MRGPLPTPTRLKLLRGNPGQRRIRPEPEAPPATPDPPAWLLALPEAVAVWQELIPGELALGVLRTNHRESFARLCERVALYRREVVTLHAGPLVTPTGRIVPEHRLVRELYEDLRVLGAQFGHTPAAMARLAAPPERVPTSKWAGLLK